MTGMAVKRSKKEALPSKRGSISGVFVSPFRNAVVAITEHITTNTTASRTDIAELYLNDSGNLEMNIKIMIQRLVSNKEKIK